MKNIYFLAGAMTMCAVSFGQDIVPYKTNTSVVYTGSKYANTIKDVRYPQRDVTRGGAYYSEDFENGLAGNNSGSQTATGAWTTAISPGHNVMVGWELTTTGHANDAGSTFTIPALMSSTGSGSGGQWMLLDSDSDGTSGVDEEATLTSPTIDLGSVGVNSLALEWQQFFAEWQNDSLWIEISTDNGSTWSGMSVGNGVGRDNRPNPEYMRMDLTPYALSGQTQVKVRFRWTGQWDYGWQLDDVQIVDLPPNNLRINTANATHYKVHPVAVQAGFSDKIAYSKIPGTQVFPISFRGNIGNLGADPQTNVTLNATVSGGVFTGSSNAITLANGSDSTVDVSGTYTPPSTPAAYEAAFEVDYDNVLSEDDPSGLVDTTVWEVTTSEFSRDSDYYSGAGLWNGETGGSSNPYRMGHVWQMQTTQMMQGISVVLSGSTDVGALIGCTVYEIDTTTTDYVEIATSVDVDIYSYHIPASAGDDPVEIWIPLQQTLAAGNQYIITANSFGGPEAIVIGNSTNSTSTSYTTFLLDGTDNTWYYLTATPMIRVHFAEPAWVGMDETETFGIELGQNLPNPFNEQTQISYSIVNAGDVQFQITDISGKIVLDQYEGRKAAGSYTLNIGASSLAPGIYNYSLITNGNKVTKRMVVTK